MSKSAQRPSFGHPYAVHRAARYLKGRGHGKVVKLRAGASYLFKSNLGYVEHAVATVVLVASPAVHADAEQGVKSRGLEISRIELGGTGSRSAKKGQWHLGGTRCDFCDKVLHTRKAPVWTEETCSRCRTASPLELLARIPLVE